MLCTSRHRKEQDAELAVAADNAAADAKREAALDADAKARSGARRQWDEEERLRLEANAARVAEAARVAAVAKASANEARARAGLAALRRAEAASAAAWYQRLVVHIHRRVERPARRAPGADRRPARRAASRSRGRRDYALEIISVHKCFDFPLAQHHQLTINARLVNEI